MFRYLKSINPLCQSTSAALKKGRCRIEYDNEKDTGQSILRLCSNKTINVSLPGEQSPLKDAVLAVHNTKDSVMKYDLL